MTVFNRRNALVGFVTLKAASRALDRRRRRSRRERVGRGLKIGLFAALALVSLGILAGVAAAFARRRHRVEQRLEGYAVAEDVEGAAAADAEAAPTEPIAAT